MAARLLHGWYVLVAGALLGAMVAFATATRVPATYEATATALVRQPSAPSPKTATDNMRPVILNRRVAAAVVQGLALQTSPDEFLGRMSAADVPGTYLLRVTVRDVDAARASRSANRAVQEAVAFSVELLRSADDKVQQTMDEEIAAARERLKGDPDLSRRLYEELTIEYGKLRLHIARDAAELLPLDEAVVPTQPVSAGPRSRVVLGALSGFSIALLLLVLSAVVAAPRP